MGDADKKKVSELTEITTVSDDDLLLIVDDPLGTPASRKMKISDFKDSIFSDFVINGENSIATLDTESSLVADGTFATSDGWTVPANWSIGSSKATCTAGSIDSLEGTTNTVINGVYKIIFTMTRSAGTLSFYLGSNLYPASYTYGQTVTVYFTSLENNASIIFTPSSTFAGTVYNLTITKIIPSDSIASFIPSDGTVDAGAIEIRGSNDAECLFIGESAGKHNYTTSIYGLDNVAIGSKALSNNVAGWSNLAIGAKAGEKTTSGSNNIFIGGLAGNKNINGGGNVFIGQGAGKYNTSGSSNFFIGAQSGFYNTIGNYNLAIGGGSAVYLKSGSYNSMIGAYSGYRMRTGSYNTFIGDSSGYYNVSGNSSIHIGKGSSLLSGNSINNNSFTSSQTDDGEIEEGQYYYQIVYIFSESSYGIPGAAPRWVQISSPNNTISFPISQAIYSGPLTCVARQIYRGLYVQDVDFSPTFYLVGTVSDNVTTSYVDKMSHTTALAQQEISVVIPGYYNSIGYNSFAIFPYQLSIGSHDAPINEVYIGKGVYPSSSSTTISDVSINASGGHGTDKAGGNIIIAGGKSTGSGAGGTVSIKTSSPSTSGTTANTLVERMKIDTTSIITTLPNTLKGTTGGLTRKLSEATKIISGASSSIEVSIPAGSKILGVQIRVDADVTSGDGGTTWSAVYSGGSTTSITTGAAFTINTKVNLLHAAEVVASETDITITPNSGTFSGGTLTAIVYYEQLEAMDDVIPT